MARRTSTVILIILATASFNLIGNEKAKNLLESIKSDDLEMFKFHLMEGANPSLYPEDSSFRSTSLCESTKIGNESFLDAILQSGHPVDYRAPYGSQYASALLCSIAYRNFVSYETLLEAGVDPNQAQYIDTDNGLWIITPLEVAAATRRFEFVVDMISRFEPNDKQIAEIVDVLERNGGLIGGKSQPYRKQLVRWLRDRGVPVDPAPAGSLK